MSKAVLGVKWGEILMLAVMVASFAMPCSAIVSKSRGVPAGWTENFDEAKERAAKEGKFILMVSCQSDGYWGAERVRGLWGSGRFAGKAKKKYVLMMIDTAKNVSNLSKRAIEENPRIIREYNLWGYNDMIILDSDGVVIRRPQSDTYGFGNISPEDLWTKLEGEMKDLTWPKPKKVDKKAKPKQQKASQGGSKAKTARKDKTLDSEPEKPLQAIPGTGKSTPAGWMDDFYAAQEIAKKEGKRLVVVFSGSDWCYWCKVLAENVLTKSKFVSEISKRYVPVYIDSPKDQSLLSDKCREQNQDVKRMLGAQGGVPMLGVYEADGIKVFSITGAGKAKDEGCDGYLEMFLAVEKGMDEIRMAKEKPDESERMKAVHAALQKIDEDVLIDYFLDDARSVVENDPSLLKDYPYLKYVDSIVTEVEGLRNEIVGKTWEKLREENGNDGSRGKFWQTQRQILKEPSYVAKFKELIAKIDKVKDECPEGASRKRLLKQKSVVMGMINGRGY